MTTVNVESFRHPAVTPINAHVTSGQTLQTANIGALEKLIRNGQAQVAKGLDSLNREWKVRVDRVVKPLPGGLTFAVRGEIPAIVPLIGGEAHNFTDHARTQMLTMLAPSMPRFAEHLIGHSLGDLLELNLNRLFETVGQGGVMVRSVDRQVKAILSPSYHRMDAAPVFEAFITKALAAGMVPQRADVTDTRCLASFIHPEIVYISPTEALVYGAELRTSDYGNGALQFAVTITRLLCTNGLIGTNLFRKVHLGKRFEGEGSVFLLSSVTEDLDHRALQSAVGDAVAALPAHYTATTEVLKANVNAEVDLPAALTRLGKKGLSKATVEKVRALYETEAPIESLPSAPGKWRFSNVLSLIANGAGGDAAIDLRDMAGEAMGVDDVKAA